MYIDLNNVTIFVYISGDKYYKSLHSLLRHSKKMAFIVGLAG